MNDFDKLRYMDKCLILFRLIDKIDYFWNFVYISNGTILLFVLNKEMALLSTLTKGLITFVYMSFMLFTIQAHIRGYVFLQNFVKEIKEGSKKQLFYNHRIPFLLQKLSYKWNILYCVVIYISMAAFILTLLW